MKKQCLLVPVLAFVMPCVPHEARAQQAVNSFTGVTLFPEGSVIRTHLRTRSLDRLLRNGDEIEDSEGREVTTFFVPTALNFGVSTNLTLAANVPYFRKEIRFNTPNGREERGASGLGDIILLGKYRFFNWNAYQTTVQLAVTGGVKLPTGATDKGPSGAPFPIPLQPGTGSTDVLLALSGTAVKDWAVLHLSGLYKLNTTGDRRYRFGDLFNYNLAAEARVVHTKYPGPELYLGVELNGEVLATDELQGASLENTGGHRLFVSPNLVFFLFRNLTLESSVQLPVLQDLNGTQLGEGPRFVFGLRFQYGLYL